MRAEKVIIKQPVGFRRLVRHGCECSVESVVGS